jgi:hypothetical protein
MLDGVQNGPEWLDRRESIDPTSEVWEACVLRLNYACSLVNILLWIEQWHIYGKRVFSPSLRLSNTVTSAHGTSVLLQSS